MSILYLCILAPPCRFEPVIDFLDKIRSCKIEILPLKWLIKATVGNFGLIHARLHASCYPGRRGSMRK